MAFVEMRITSISFYKVLKPFVLLLSCIIAIISAHCVQTSPHNDHTFIDEQVNDSNPLINPQGGIIATRFETPKSFERVRVAPHSFADYLRHLPLKKAGAKVKYYNGREKDDKAYIAVVDMDIGTQNLQQCADAIMRLRGEYFYAQRKYDSIFFTLTNGFTVDYSKWMTGYRIKVTGNHTEWIKTAAVSNAYKDFRNFMDVVFTYAGTLSLSKILRSKSIKDISAGDVFIVGGAPGHAVIVADVAQDKNGNRIFMLAQSYMPAQETQVLRNPNDEEISPWYRNDFGEELTTPEWVFRKDQLKTWH